MSQLVKTVNTPVSKLDFLKAALEWHPELTSEQVGILWAQYAVETTSGKNCYGWNLGNIKHFDGDGHNYHVLKGVTEYDEKTGVWTNVAASDPGSRFCAFASLDEGMAVYLHMFTHGRYQPCWPTVLSCDPIAFAQKLHDCGWYTAPASKYKTAMLAQYNLWLQSKTYMQTDSPPETPPASTQPIVYADPFPSEDDES